MILVDKYKTLIFSLLALPLHLQAVGNKQIEDMGQPLIVKNTITDQDTNVLSIKTEYDSTKPNAFLKLADVMELDRFNGVYPWEQNIWITTKRSIPPKKIVVKKDDQQEVILNVLHYIPHKKLDIALILTDRPIPHCLASRFCLPIQKKQARERDCVLVSGKSLQDNSSSETILMEHTKEQRDVLAAFTRIDTFVHKSIYFSNPNVFDLNSWIRNVNDRNKSEINDFIEEFVQSTFNVANTNSYVHNISQIKLFEKEICLFSYIKKIFSQDLFNKEEINTLINKINLPLLKEANLELDLTIFENAQNIDQTKEIILKEIEQITISLKEILEQLYDRLSSSNIDQPLDNKVKENLKNLPLKLSKADKSYSVTKTQAEDELKKLFDVDSRCIGIPDAYDKGGGIFDLFPADNGNTFKYQLGLIGITFPVSNSSHDSNITEVNTGIDLRNPKILDWINCCLETYQPSLSMPPLDVIASKHAVVIAPNLVLCDLFKNYNQKKSFSKKYNINDSDHDEINYSNPMSFHLNDQKFHIQGCLPVGGLVLYQLDRPITTSEDLKYPSLNKDDEYTHYLYDEFSNDIKINHFLTDKVSLNNEELASCTQAKNSYNREYTSFILTTKDETSNASPYKIYQIGNQVITPHLAYEIERIIKLLDSGELKTIETYTSEQQELDELSSEFVLVPRANSRRIQESNWPSLKSCVLFIPKVALVAVGVPIILPIAIPLGALYMYQMRNVRWC